MPQSGGDFDLEEKPLGSERGGELRSQDLQGDGSIVPDVVGEIDRSHTAASELALDAIAVGQGGREEGRTQTAALAGATVLSRTALASREPACRSAIAV